MSTIFIVLIVIASLATLAVGCSSDQTMVLAPTCSTEHYHDNKAKRCILKYNWLRNSDGLYRNNNLVRCDQKYADYVVARMVLKNGDQIPYSAAINVTKSIVPLPNLERDSYNRFEVLQVKPAGHYQWVYSSNGIVEKNAIEGGSINNEIVYICQKYYDDYNYVGAMIPHERACYFKVLEAYYSDYFLLTYGT